MMLRNPFVLVTIPLAFALGLIWFRRKKIHCDSGGSKKKSTDNKTKTTAAGVDTNNLSNNNLTNSGNGTRPDLKQSVSVPIGSTPRKHLSSPINNNDSFDFKFGKSAPIDITPQKTSPSRMKNGDKQLVDANELKSKIEDVEFKTLNSIEEHSFDSVDLPGSIECRRRFSFTVKPHEPAVVVKAATMVTNKSPQSSFGDTVTTPSPPKSQTVVKQQSGESKLNKNKTINNKNVSDKLQVNTSTEHSETETPTRILPVSSPPLSLCSNKSTQSHDSGDSGKGSSPPNSEGGQTLSSIISYDFELAQTHVGYLVGKEGANVKNIKAKTHASILIKRHPTKNSRYKLCTIQGTKQQVDAAIEMIKKKLPQRANLKQVHFDIDLIESSLLPASAINSDLLQVGKFIIKN